MTTEQTEQIDTLDSATLDAPGSTSPPVAPANGRAPDPEHAGVGDLPGFLPQLEFFQEHPQRAGRNGRPIRFDVRPLLVVGVGGSGCLAVKHMKRRVLQLSHGKAVPFIRYVVLDTTIQDPAGEPLDDGEFVNLGLVDFNDIVRNIRDYPHLASWFPCEKFKPMQLGVGAMGVRHIGRLCYFQYRETPRVLGLLRDRIQELMNPTLADKVGELGFLKDVRLDQSTGLDIHIIGSGAGGTGSGVFLDLAYDLRKLALEQARAVQVVGHLLLPDAFVGLIPENLMPQAENNSFALLSELNHFIEEGDWNVQYKSERVSFEKRKQAPVDLIYLLSRTGQDGGVRKRDELVSMMGCAVASLALTRVGKRIREDTANLMPHVLNSVDLLANKARPYGSYGICIGESRRDEVVAAGQVVLPQRLLASVLGRDPESRRRMHQQADAFLRSHHLTADSLERLKPALPHFPTDGLVFPEDARLRREDWRGAQFPAQLAGLQEKWRAGRSSRFEQVTPDAVFQELKRLYTTGNPDDPGPAPPRLGEIVEFLAAIVESLRQTSSECENRKLELASAGRMARNDLETIQASGAMPGWQPRYAHLVRIEDEELVGNEFYPELIQAIDRAVLGLEQTLWPALRFLEQTATELQRQVNQKQWASRELKVPYLRFFSHKDVLAQVYEDCRGPAVLLRQHFMAVLQRYYTQDGDFTDVPRVVRNAVADATTRAVEDELDRFTLDGHLELGRMLPELHRRDQDVLHQRLSIQYTSAQPALRCIEILPKESLVYMGRIGADAESPAVTILRSRDGTIQAEDDNPTELLLMRFVYGLPLWAVQGADAWEESAVEVQTAQGLTHNFLDPSWAPRIKPFHFMREEHREDVWLFTLFARQNAITKAKWNYEFTLNGRNLFDSPDREPAPLENRLQAFNEFVRCLQDGRLSRCRARELARDFLDQQGSHSEQAAFLKVYHQELLKRLEGTLKFIGKVAANGVREDARILRDELTVLLNEINRKFLDALTEPAHPAVSPGQTAS